MQTLEERATTVFALDRLWSMKCTRAPNIIHSHFSNRAATVILLIYVLDHAVPLFKTAVVFPYYLGQKSKLLELPME